MSMNAWGLLAAPLMAHLQAPAQATQDGRQIAAPQSETSELFDGLAMMDENAMVSASGGQDTAVDIANLGVNLADNNGSVEDVNVENAPTGQIANNAVNGNSGITTVFNNTNNGVVFQSAVNVNIFLNGQ